MNTIILAMIILGPGFLAIQHQELIVGVNDIVYNTTTQIEQYNYEMTKNIGIITEMEVRIHNDVQQLLEHSNDELNITSRIIDSKHFE